jgi:hypothetical protein
MFVLAIVGLSGVGKSTLIGQFEKELPLRHFTASELCASLDLLGGRAVPAYYDDGHNTPPENINSDDDDPYNRPGMTSWRRNTPAFTIIRVLADLRQRSKAVPAGSYNPVYADDNVLVFERRYGTKSSSSPSIAAPPRRSRSEAVWTYRLAPIVASLPIPAKSTKETR